MPGRLAALAIAARTAAIAETSFLDPRRGGVPMRVARRVHITTGTLPPAALPVAGQDMFRRYGARYGDPDPDRYAANGYEAMRLVLDALAAGGSDRDAIRRWLDGVGDRPGVLGTYGFDCFGDTTLKTFGVYGIRRGELAFEGTATAP